MSKTVDHTSPGINIEMVYCNGINANALANPMHRHCKTVDQKNAESNAITLANLVWCMSTLNTHQEQCQLQC